MTNAADNWVYFNRGLAWAAGLGTVGVQAAFFFSRYDRLAAASLKYPDIWQNLLVAHLPLASILVVLVKLLGRLFSQSLGRLRLGRQFAVAGPGYSFVLGVLKAVMAVFLLGVVYWHSSLRFLLWPAFSVFLAFAMAGIITISMMFFNDCLPRKPEKEPTDPLAPLRLIDPGCGEHSPEFVARQAARPEDWQGQWPDDPRLTDIRHHLGRLFRKIYGFKTDAFLPDDEMAAIFAMGDEFNDEVGTIITVEAVFGLKIDDDLAQTIRLVTFGDFARLVLELAGPDYDASMEAAQAEPLSLPDDYHKPGRSYLWRKLPFIGRDDGWHKNLRDMQALRSPRWGSRWPDEPDLISLRDKVSRFLVEKFNWFDEAFLPEDRLSALFHSDRGLEYVPQALEAFNREFGQSVTTEFIMDPSHTYLDLLRHCMIKPIVPSGHWPDDARLLEVRDRLMRIFRIHYGCPKNSFRPDYPMKAIFALGDEFNDPVGAILLVELAFDIKIDDDMLLKNWGQTFGDFVRLVLEAAGPDYEAKTDSEFLSPLSLPEDYHRPGRWAFFKRKLPLMFGDKHWHRELREAQALRSPRWFKRWPDEPDLIALRDRVSRFLVEKFDWFDEAFIPEDRLNALFHSTRGLEYVPQVVEEFNREFDTDISPGYIMESGRTYLDLLNLLRAK